MITLDQFGILHQYLPQLYGGHIVMTLSAEKKGVIVFFYRLIDPPEFIGISLENVDVLCGKIP